MNSLPVLAGLGLLLSGALAGADDFTPVSGVVPAELHFDTPVGFYDQWRGKIECPINALRTAVRINVLRPTPPNWHPNFAVALMSGRLQVMIQVRSSSEGQPPLRAILRKTETQAKNPELLVGKGEEQDFREAFALGERVPIAIDWTADGHIAVQIGGEMLSYDLGVSVEELRFTAAHSEGTFDPILVGFTGSEKTARAECRVVAALDVAKIVGT